MATTLEKAVDCIRAWARINECLMLYERCHSVSEPPTSKHRIIAPKSHKFLITYYRVYGDGLSEVFNSIVLEDFAGKHAGFWEYVESGRLTIVPDTYNPSAKPA